MSWSTTGGTIEGGGPAVTATETGLYTATVTNPPTGITEADVEVVAADAAPVLSGGLVEPLTCLTPNQPVVGLTIGDYAPFGTGNLTPVVSWINAENGTTMGVSPATGSIGPIIDAAGTYQVTVEWQETGCSSSLTVDAVEGEDFGVDISSLTFPNILTANNDGKNDSWYPFLADLPDVEARRADQLRPAGLQPLGQVVYTNAGNGFASGTPIRWYGNGNGGDPLSAGAYYHVVDYTSTCGTARAPAEVCRDHPRVIRIPDMRKGRPDGRPFKHGLVVSRRSSRRQSGSREVGDADVAVLGEVSRHVLAGGASKRQMPSCVAFGS